MRTVDLERTIRAPITEVFDWLTETTNYERVPFVRRVTPVRPGDVIEHGEGAVRLMVTPLMRILDQVVEYVPPKRIRYKLLKSAPLLRRQDGCIRFEEVAGGTRVRWRNEIDCSIGIFGDALTVAMMPLWRLGVHLVLSTADKELRRD